MTGALMVRGLVLAALIWLGVAAYSGVTTLPGIPLDLSRQDPQVLAAFHKARRDHILRHALIGLGPLAGALALAWALRRGSRRR